MNKNNKPSGVDALLDAASNASGESREKLASAINSNPMLSSVISKMSANDVTRLQGIINNPSAVEKLLENPKAKQLIEKLGKNAK